MMCTERPSVQNCGEQNNVRDQCVVIRDAPREEHSQINVILQQKLPAAKLSTVCTIYIYKQRLVATVT